MKTRLERIEEALRLDDAEAMRKLLMEERLVRAYDVEEEDGLYYVDGDLLAENWTDFDGKKECSIYDPDMKIMSHDGRIWAEYVAMYLAEVQK